MESLAVKYRPKTWEDVVEQETTVRILKKQIETKTFKNAYLFCGPSGDGKTTIGRIFASEINSGNGSPIEIDGASNNGVDNVRNIIAIAKERSLDSEYKVIIVDEAHMLTIQGWNAFLKCLEEPPKYTVFIFCTTDPQKIPATILNRVQRFNLTRISPDSIKNRLKTICDIEKFSDYDLGIEYISKISNGGMRDAISYLEKCASYSNEITLSNVLDSLGNYSYDIFFKLLNNIIDGQERDTLQILDDYYNQGNDLKLFADQFLTFVMDIAKYVLFGSMDILKIPNNMEDKVKFCTNIEGANNYYTYLIDKLLDIKVLVKNDLNIKTTLEVMFLKLCRCK